MSEDKKASVQPFTVTGNWENQSKALKATFSSLTDNDLKFEKGQENELIQRLSTRLNKNQEEVITILKKGEQIRRN